MSKTSVPTSASNNISASTEEKVSYQAAITRFGSSATMSDIHRCAERNGWDFLHFLGDVWRELYDGNFEPWLAEPVRAEA